MNRKVCQECQFYMKSSLHNMERWICSYKKDVIWGDNNYKCPDIKKLDKENIDKNTNN